MKNHFLIYFLAIFTFLSCKNNQDEMVELNSFLQANYEFNNKTLNQNKGDYYMKIEEQPERKIDKLNEMDSRFEVLISNIDSAISNKETNIEKIVADYNDILNEIPEIVNQRKDYLIPEFESTINSNEFRLNTIKNQLVIAMAYTFEYASRPTFVADGLKKLDYINTNISKNENNSIKITLTSDLAQNLKENRQIIINNINYNGKDEKVNYELIENHSFADIVLDSLKKGNYRLEGILRYYHRTGKIDIPFKENFEVE